jgi:hypothetical protein
VLGLIGERDGSHERLKRFVGARSAVPEPLAGRNLIWVTSHASSAAVERLIRRLAYFHGAGDESMYCISSTPADGHTAWSCATLRVRCSLH